MEYFKVFYWVDKTWIKMNGRIRKLIVMIFMFRVTEIDMNENGGRTKDMIHSSV